MGPKWVILAKNPFIGWKQIEKVKYIQTAVDSETEKDFFCLTIETKNEIHRTELSLWITDSSCTDHVIFD